MKNSYIVIMIVSAFVFGSIFGFYAGTLNMPGKSSGLSKDFISGWKAAEEKLKTAGIIPARIESLSGQVKKVSGNKIEFQANNGSPLSGMELKDRTAVITDATVITVYEQKSPEQMNKDSEEARKITESLEKERKNLQEEYNSCVMSATDNVSAEDMMVGGSICVEEMEALNNVNDDMMKAMDLSSATIRRNGSVNDIVEGSNINVSSKALEGAEDDPAFMERREDISEKKEFEVGTLDVWINNIMDQAIDPGMAN